MGIMEEVRILKWICVDLNFVVGVGIEDIHTVKAHLLV